MVTSDAIQNDFWNLKFIKKKKMKDAVHSYVIWNDVLEVGTA